jgi:outer membrane receptor for ferrienterochelin and colicins
MKKYIFKPIFFRHNAVAVLLGLATFLSFLLSCSALLHATEPAALNKLSIEQLMDLEVDTVYGASRYDQKVTDAPSSISIVTSDEIKKYGYRTLADILKSVRGFFITNDRNYSYVGVRGFGRPGDYNSRILVQIDGHRINDNVYDQVLIGEEFILDVDLIDRVEIIRGPSSSLYGSNAFFAVINIVTRRGRDVGKPEASGSAGSLQTYKGRITYGNFFDGGPEVIVSGSGLDSKGHRTLFYKEFDFPETNNGITRNTDYEYAHNFFTSFSLYGLTMQGAYSSREKGIPTASFNADFNDPRNRTIDEYGYADLKYEKNIGDDVDVVARLFYDRSRYNGDYIYSGVLNKDSSRGDWWGSELTLKKTLFERHTVILGTSYVDNIHQDQSNYNVQPYAFFLDDRRRSTNWAYYAQDEFAINKRLILNVGVRQDHFETFGDTTNPRLGLIYKPFDKTIFKLLYGQAFRAPNAYELYYNDGGLSSKGNAELRPEKIRTYEFIYEQYIGEHVRSSVSVFHYKIKDLISQTIDPADSLLIFKNIDSVDSNGFEMELECKWAGVLQAKGSYSYQDTENDLTHQVLTNSPKHLAKINFIVPVLQEKLFAGVEEQYTSKRRTTMDNFAGAFFVTNLTFFGRDLAKGLDLSASLYNLFDKKYGDPGAGNPQHRQDVIQQDGRGYRFKVTYRF